MADSSIRSSRLRHEDRRDEIIQAVIDVCAEDGISRLSVSSVTQRVGCTRSLFYHYFPNKETALEAALDTTIDNFIESLRTWNAERTPGDIEGALDNIAGILKSAVVDSPGLPKILRAHGNATLYTNFVDRVADRCARYICSSTVVDFAKAHDILIDHVYETFYMLISGLILFIRSHPDTPCETIKDIIASTLHVEGYTSKYSERRPAR